ncbi:MAG TPA: catalase family peroxidase [Acidimicrobiales bacterium]|nr:catalase family peroxidase [Acidimicrobiales bacterium]
MGDLSERLVDALNAAYGVHAGHRAAHAKGVLCAATFTALPAAATLTRAAHFQGEPTRAHVRFSNGAGDPTIADGTRDARGMAIKAYLPDGSTTDVVTLTLPTFFVRTPEELIEFNLARRPDPATGVPDMEKVGAFLAEHPETVPAVTAAITAPIPASYTRLTYHAIHTFKFVSREGVVRPARYHFVPVDGDAAISDDEAAVRPEHYLRAELEDRLARGPAVFHVELELAAEDDPLDDPTAIWPEGRARVRVAELAITALAFDREKDGDVVVFDPTRLTDGIEATDDKILAARSGAYRVSVARRTP